MSSRSIRYFEECVPCQLNDQSDELPPRERIYLADHWRVAHAWSALPGWLVVIARRHVIQLADLTQNEATSLGRLLRATSIALRSVRQCQKTYVMLFAESIPHLHFHVVPRMPDFEDDMLGPQTVRAFLDRPESEWVTTAERDELALHLATELRDAFAA